LKCPKNQEKAEKRRKTRFQILKSDEKTEKQSLFYVGSSIFDKKVKVLKNVSTGTG